jgi:two-component system, chemotaxis family, sensor kinase CheA
MSEDLDFLKEIIDEFLVDAAALSGAIDAGLAALEREPKTLAGVEEMANALYTLRMQAGFLDFDSLTAVALGMERMLDQARQGGLILGATALELLQQANQALGQMLEQLRTYDIHPLEVDELAARMQSAIDGTLEEDANATTVPAEEEELPEAKVAKIGGEPVEEEDLPRHDDVAEQEETEKSAEIAAEAVEAPLVSPPVAHEPTPAFEPELEEVEVIEGAISEDVADFIPDFLTESSEILDKLDEDLVRLEEASDDLELLNEIFRAAHTLKGTGAFLGFAQMSDLTHKMENVLDLLRKEEMQLNQGITDVILQGVDQIKILRADIENNAIVRRDMDDLRGNLLIIAETRGELLGGAPVLEEQIEQPAAEEEDAGVVISADASPPQAAPPPPPAPAARQADQVIRVDVDRIETIMNLTEELVLGRNRLLQLNDQLLTEHGEEELADRLNETTLQVDMLTGELQESVMKMRMVPVSRVFSRFPRMVRDLARDLDKQIELVVEDNDTEIDKSVADEIGDPLIHLIRNAVDHGVETPETRQQAGKEARGVVLLSAVHEGNHIVIRICDDGAGMDPEKLKQKGIEKGVLSEEDAAPMEAGDAYNLIFAPGFSTAEKVSGVSGRGVGMDVVKTNITRLSGTIDLDSTFGQGTEITIRLPLTLAIISGLQVGAGKEMFIIPLTSVIEAVRISQREIESLQGRKVIVSREKVLPLVELDKVLEIPGEANRAEIRYVVVVGLAERRVGILVDRLLRQVDVVIKALGDIVGPAEGIAGATILGDGRVCLILDVGDLIEMVDREKVQSSVVGSKITTV